MKKFIVTRVLPGLSLAGANVVSVAAVAVQPSQGNVLGASTDAQLTNTGSGTVVSILVGVALLVALAVVSRKVRTQN